jgi:ubiquinone/menaquinone biosynthesis C-methylase UbiE
MNDGKFEKVADSYSKMFYYSPYYTMLAEFLEKHLGDATSILEIGAADGIVAMAWNRLRKSSSNSAPLTYFAVEPVERMVNIAKERTKEMTIKFLPTVGDIEHAVGLAEIENAHIDGLVISRVLHEVFIQHNLDHVRLFADIQRVLEAKHPKVVVLGIVNRYIGLNAEETQQFIEEQTKEIGHGHDPAKEYVDQNLLDVFMQSQCYKIIDRDGVTQPLNGFDPSPWGETITVYRAE